MRWHRKEFPKSKKQSWYERTISNNQQKMFPLLRPSEEEKSSNWMEGFGEVEDEEDEDIDRMFKELEHVSYLRPCDGVVDPEDSMELEELSNGHQMNKEDQETCGANNEGNEGANVGGEDVHRERLSPPTVRPSNSGQGLAGFTGGFAAFSGGQNWSHRFDVLAEEIKEMKKTIAENKKEIDVKFAELSTQLNLVVQMLQSREHEKRMIPGGRKRKALKAKPREVARRLMFSRKKMKNNDGTACSTVIKEGVAVKPVCEN